MNTPGGSLPTVRRVCADDHATWLPLWRGYQVFYAMDIPDSTSVITWQRFLDPAERMHAAVAEQGGSVVGMTHFTEHRSTGSPIDVVYLQDLFTAEAARGRGVGRALVEHVYAHARAMGSGRVHWLTNRDNTAAQRLYDTLAERSPYLQYRKVF